jgi:hypothetical protein
MRRDASGVVHLCMLAQLLILVAVLAALVGLLCDAVSQRRLIRTIQSHLTAQDDRVSACEAHVDTLSNNHRKLDARQDRLTSMVQERGWRDSMLLTRFDWRNPRDRG